MGSTWVPQSEMSDDEPLVEIEMGGGMTKDLSFHIGPKLAQPKPKARKENTRKPRGSTPGGPSNPDPCTWKIKHVQQWLTSLGLERYGPAFQENAIDGEMLMDPACITEDNLKEMGVDNKFHAMKIMRRLGKLRKTKQEAMASGGPTGRETLSASAWQASQTS